MGVPGLMYRVRLRSFIRLFTSGPGQRRMQYWAWAVLGTGVSVAVFFLSWVGLYGLSRVPGGPELVGRVPAGVFTLAAFALVFTGLAAAVYTMYLSDDVEVLSAMPVRERTIFAYKFWETLLGNSTFFVALALPVLLACGIVLGAPVLYFLSLPVVSVLVLMLSTGLCVLLVMPLMRLLPAGKAREIVATLGVFMGVAFYAAYFWLLQPDRAGGTDPLRTLGASPLLNAPPGSWASGALSGDFLGGLLPLGAVALGLYFVCLSLTGWAYATGRARAAESGGRVRSAGWVGRALGFLPRDARAVAAKDLVELTRDLRRSAFLVFPAAMLVVVLGFNYSNLSGGTAGFSSLLAYLPAGGFGAVVAFQGGCMAVGIEGRSYWMLAASPLGPKRILWGKWAANTLAGCLFALLGPLGAAVFLGLDPLGLLAGVAVGFLGSGLGALYGVGFGALFPRFDWENPNQTMTMGGGLLAGLCLLVLLGSAALAGLLVFALGNLLLPLWAAVAAVASLWLAVVGGVGYLIFAGGAGSLGRMNWEF